jgi:hypothetical protein
LLLGRLIICIPVLRLYFTGGKFNAFASGLTWPILNLHRLQLGILGYLIPIYALTFVPHRQLLLGRLPSPLALPLGS